MLAEDDVLVQEVDGEPVVEGCIMVEACIHFH